VNHSRWQSSTALPDGSNEKRSPFDMRLDEPFLADCVRAGGEPPNLQYKQARQHGCGLPIVASQVLAGSLYYRLQQDGRSYGRQPPRAAFLEPLKIQF